MNSGEYFTLFDRKCGTAGRGGQDLRFVCLCPKAKHFCVKSLVKLFSSEKVVTQTHNTQYTTVL